MEINLYLLKDALADLHPDGTISDKPEKRKLQKMRLCTQTQSIPERFSQQVLYLISAAVMPHIPDDARSMAFLCVEEPDASRSPHFRNLLYCTVPIALEELCNRVTDCFDMYQTWAERLQTAVDAHMPLKELAVRSARFFRNPVSLLSASFRLLFAWLPPTENPNAEYLTFQQHLLPGEGEPLSEKEMLLLLRNQGYRETIEGGAAQYEIQYKAPYISEKLNVLIRNVVLHGVSVGQLCMDAIVVPITDADRARIGILAAYIAKRLDSDDINVMGRLPQIDEILQSLLDHRLIPESRIIRAVDTLHWQMFDTYLCINIKSGTGVKKADILSPLFARISNALPQSILTPYRDSVVMIVDLTQARLDKQAAVRAMLPHLRDAWLIAGISEVYHDFKDLYYAFCQTEFAMQIGKKKRPERWYFSFEDYRFDYLLSWADTKPQIAALIPEQLRRLLKYDDEHKTAYTRMLFVYLKNERNIAASIRELYMHRNTFLYQSQKAADILDMDLDSWENRCLLMLSLRILYQNGIVDLSAYL